MLKKISAILVAAVLMAVMAVPALAFVPDQDPALSLYLGFEGNIGNATTLFKDEPVRTPHLNTPGGNINFSEGKVGQGFNFDGETGLYLGNDIVTGNNFTISMWFNAREVMSWVSVFHARFLDGDDESGEDEFWMCIRPRTELGANPEHNMMFWTCGGGYYDYWFDGVTTVHVEDNRWYHVALTVAGEDIVMYVDGENTFDTRTSDAHFTSSIDNLVDAMRSTSGRRFYLGINEFQDWPFRGTIDEFYAFNRTLSQDEVKTLMNYNPLTAAPAEDLGVGGGDAADVPAIVAPVAPVAAVAAPVPAPETNDGMIFFIIFTVAAAALVKKAKKI
jgi:hypothetical protein